MPFGHHQLDGNGHTLGYTTVYPPLHPNVLFLQSERKVHKANSCVRVFSVGSLSDIDGDVQNKTPGTTKNCTTYSTKKHTHIFDTSPYLLANKINVTIDGTLSPGGPSVVGYAGPWLSDTSSDHILLHSKGCVRAGVDKGSIKYSLPPLSGADIGQDDPPFRSIAVRNQFDGGLVSVLAKCFIYLPHKRVWFDFRSILSDFFLFPSQSGMKGT